LALFFLLGCGDKPPPVDRGGTTPVEPTNGSAVVAPTNPDAAIPVEPSRIALRASGKPPLKSARPLARQQLVKLAALEIPTLTRTVRKLDESFLDVEYRHQSPSVVVSVVAQPCLRCLPMQVDRWRAESDALRITIPPDLRDRTDLRFEIDAIAIGGTPAIRTHQQLFAVKFDSPIFEHAVTVYFADGVNQIRVTASYDGTVVNSGAEMADVISRGELEQLAVAVLDRYTQTW
jgi:hypothetical protein